MYRFVCFISLLVLTIASTGSPDRPLHGIADPVNPPISIQRTKDCPNGLKLVGKSCIETHVLSPELVCPPSTAPFSEECVSFVEAFRRCPDNCPRVGEQCVCSSCVPASPVCDSGDLVGKQCRVETSVPPTCPVGFQLQAGQCLRYKPQNLVCPADYQLQGTQCVQRVSFPATPVCLADYSLADTAVCTKSIPIPPRCNAGLLLIRGECVKEVSRELTLCPNGFSAFGDFCEQERHAEPRLVCPVGFSFESRKCFQEVPTLPACPAMTKRGSTQQCERVVAKRPVCGTTEQLINGQCRHTSTLAATLTCPDGYSLDGSACKNVYAEAPHLRCSHGTLQEGQCATQSSTPTRLQCPSGYQVDKGLRCVRDVPYDCSEPAVECDVVHQSNLTTRQLNPNYKAKSTSPLLPKIVAHSVSSSVTRAAPSVSSNCSLTKQTAKQTCTKVEVVPVQHVCPNGFTPNGKTCTMMSTHPPQVFCKTGSLDQAAGQCVTVSTRSAIPVCPVGGLQPDGQCLAIRERPPKLICPEDASLSVLDQCVVFEPEIPQPPTIVHQPAQAVCDAGVLRGRICVTLDRIPRDAVCPSGSEDRSGGCVVTGPVFTPQPLVLTQSASYVCPNGSATADRLCFNTETLLPERVCPENGMLRVSNCLYTAPLLYHRPIETLLAPRLTCPSVYERQQNDQCCLTRFEVPSLECPSGFSRFKDGRQECIRSHPRVPVCPTGTEKVGDECIKKTYVPPRVTEIKVCTKGQPGC